MEVHYITRDDPRSWALMPQVFLRLYNFCNEIDSETEPNEVVDLVRGWFLVGDPSRLAIWVVVDDQGYIIAHLMATTEPFGLDHFRYVLIRQAKVDEGHDIGDITKHVFGQVLEWAKSMGLNKVLMLTHREEAAMSRKWGFTPYKSLMKLNID